MTPKSLNKLLKVWQERLKLRDWAIDLRLVDGKEFDSAGQSGETCLRLIFKEADIKVKAGLSNEDTELTLVHELVHVLFGGLQPPEGLQEVLFETGVEACARALIAGHADDD